jgi:dihydroneopterin aldolase
MSPRSRAALVFRSLFGTISRYFVMRRVLGECGVAGATAQPATQLQPVSIDLASENLCSWSAAPTAPGPQEDQMNATADYCRIQALFVSHVQRSHFPTVDLIRDAVADTIDRLGADRCAELVAQEYGEHPDCAPSRMRWARSAIRLAFP